MTTTTLVLPDFLPMGQNVGITCDSQPDLNMCHNCGTACAAMLCAWCSGVLVYPDTIHDVIKGEQYRGDFSNVDLEQYLAQYCSIQMTQYTPRAGADLLATERAYLAAGRPLLLLRYGDHAGPSHPGEVRAFHWVVVVGMTLDEAVARTIIHADPWDGAFHEEPAADHLGWAGICSIGTYLVAGCERVRCIQQAAPPSIPAAA